MPYLHTVRCVESRNQDYIWCEENENDGPDGRRPVERPHPCPTIKKCPVFNGNWYRDQVRCEENENAGRDDHRTLERPHPTPSNIGA